MELVKQNQQENIKRKLKTELEGLSKEEVIEKYMDLYENKIAQEDFILNISHDLRSPLSVILGILQCYKNEYDELKAEEHMNIVKRNCYKILKLINNIIDSTKLQQTNVEECIVAVDISSFDRIIMNLISNAIKFSKENSCVFINTWKEEKYITISVKDEGIGIPQNEQKTIFNRFIQSTKNNRNEYSGSGIGLDLVFNLVKAHGGVVELTSTEGLGSEFRIKMPIVKVEDSMKKDKHSMDLSSKVDIFEVEFSDIYV